MSAVCRSSSPGLDIGAPALENLPKPVALGLYRFACRTLPVERVDRVDQSPAHRPGATGVLDRAAGGFETVGERYEILGQSPLLVSGHAASPKVPSGRATIAPLSAHSRASASR